MFELMERNMYEHIKERKTPLEEKRVKKYLYQLIKGLEFIHRQGIFHRDIKPFLFIPINQLLLEKIYF